ncbi:MAG TPA: ABC transporter permease [Candidatus Anaerotruncus excrementipullorum]|uniref:ABC transporter permease n=1 Tax=Candidatus Anaerotruncus excrementipullorum TaxID=2838465 RepID=A0A9D1WQU9_9FIRM|nr:ABC transporter permease [Candidatus Anaerotruncus excrementipullorum]
MEQIGLWDKLESSNESREKLWTKSRTFAGDVWFRFRHKPTSLAGLLLIAALLFFALVGPLLLDHDYSQQNLDYVNMPPSIQVTHTAGSSFYITSNLKLIEVGADGTLLQPVPRLQDDFNSRTQTFDYNGATLTLNYGLTPPALVDEAGNPISDIETIHNKDYPLGTDGLGRDMLARLMYGARISLLVAFIAAAVNMCIGILYGGIAGLCGGMVDSVMMRIVDIINTIPLTLYVILISVVLGNNSGLVSIVIALSSVYWVDMARVVRGQVLTLKGQEFVFAARTIGTSSKDILLRHLIPNAMGPILVTVTMLIPQAIFMEAFLSFIGLGVAPPMASLGTMCNDAIEALRTSPYQLFLPALVICITMFGFNFVGDGLRDALDPKLKK